MSPSRIILLFLSLAVCACAGGRAPARRVAAPTVAPVTAPVFRAKAALVDSQAAGERAQTAVAESRTMAKELFHVVAPDLRPLVEALQTKLAAADEELTRVKDLHSVTLSALEESLGKADALQAQMDAQSSAFNEAVTENAQLLQARSELRSKLTTVTRKLWSWRLGSAFTAFAGLAFVLRRPLGAAFGIPVP